MRSTILFVALLISVLFALGCTGDSNPVQTTASPERDAACGGNQNPPGGPNQPSVPGGNPIKPPPPVDFQWDCLQLYKVDYLATMPDGMEKDFSGALTIFDAACDVDTSEVMVRFMVDAQKFHARALFIPGNKVVSDEGTFYTGNHEVEKEFPNGGLKLNKSFELTVTSDPDNVDQLLITGTLTLERHIWFTLPDGTQKDEDRIITFVINGNSVDAIEPPPPPPGDGNPPPPPGGNG